jgi:two-component system nitrogen regulation response regulator NtrX
LIRSDILVVDDEQDILDLISGVLSDEGYTTRTALDGVRALSEIRTRQPNLVILDVWLGNDERDGLKVLETTRLHHPHVPVIMISGHASIETAVSAIKQGAYDFLEKPFQTERLLVAVERAIESTFLRQENDQLKFQTGLNAKVVGHSVSATRLRQQIQESAEHSIRILLEGPIGVGKQTTARLIHHHCPKPNSPFLSLNCAAILSDHLETELFGTDIVDLNPNIPRKIGLFEQANGGTLYLSCLEKIPIPVQSLISRFLKDGFFVRIGGKKTIQTDIRLIGGILKPAKYLMETGQLLPDLFYRLSVQYFVLPLLKERASDIPEFIKYFAQKISMNLGTISKRFSQEIVYLLQSFEWPGNLDELHHTVERILIYNKDHPSPVISSDLLPQNIWNSAETGPVSQTSHSEIVVMPLRQAREVFEKEYLTKQIQRFDGNISRTAQFIGMERSALHRKLKSLGVVDMEISKRNPH